MRFSAVLQLLNTALGSLPIERVEKIAATYLQDGLHVAMHHLQATHPEVAKTVLTAAAAEVQARGGNWAVDHMGAAIATFAPLLLTQPAPDATPPPEPIHGD